MENQKLRRLNNMIEDKSEPDNIDADIKKDNYIDENIIINGDIPDNDDDEDFEEDEEEDEE